MFRQRGFSFLDLLIGLVISLVGMLAVSRVMVSFTQQRNTIAQTAEAQSNGTMALYLIERDLGQAGYGMKFLSNCGSINWYQLAGGCTTTCTHTLSPLPFSIAFGGAASDAITVQYANTTSGAPATTISIDQTAWANPYDVSSSVGFDNNTDMIAVNAGGVCTMGQVSAVNKPLLKISHDSASIYNPASVPPAGAGGGWNLAHKDDVLVNLGNFVSKTYSVSGTGNLQAAGFGQASSLLVDGIVFMKAQYGLDTNGDQQVDQWVTGATVVATNQVLAVRVGIVARSPLYERDPINAPATLTVLPAPPLGPATAVTYTLPVDGAGQVHYRYKAYNTIIPLRNAIW